MFWCMIYSRGKDYFIRVHRRTVYRAVIDVLTRSIVTYSKIEDELVAAEGYMSFSYGQNQLSVAAIRHSQCQDCQPKAREQAKEWSP